MIAGDRARQLEAVGYLLAAEAAVRTIPFRWLTRLFARAPHRPELRGPSRAQAREQVQRGIHQARRRLPATIACFPCAIAAQAMLRRRGVATTLYCGAATSPGRGLTAHVWLQDGEIGVTGQRASVRYQALAQYAGGNHHEERVR